MYTEFFGLHEKPFSITPDPRYLFMSEQHGEGLAHLVYGVQESGGFIQLTGEVGTGKTTLVRTLLTRIPDGVDVALILNPQLSAIEFLTAICEELQIDLPEDRDSAKALVDALNRHLLASHADGRRTILLIDEAQNLATEVLEQVRLLTNLETAKQKLLQIILIAQPELRDKLSQTNLRQLAQRVTGRFHLQPLSRSETDAYIDHRMKVAGAVAEVFDDRAKREVYKLSGGVPRLVNVISDRSLLGAYSLEQRQITPQTVRKAANEVSGEGARATRNAWLPVLGILTAVLLLAGVWAITTETPEPATTSEVPVTAIDVGESMPENVEAAAPAPSPEPELATLDDVLHDPGTAADSTTAIASLLEIWGVDFSPTGGNACLQAEAAGLICLNQRGSWQIIQQLDRPVALTLTDSSGSIHQAVLVAVDGDRADLRFGERTMSFPVRQLTSLWYGRYLLLWKPPGGDASIIRRGARGAKVLWLRQSLAVLNAAADPGAAAIAGQSDVFDQALERELMEFQRRNRLEVDGLAGQQTQIIINSQLRIGGTPRLSGS